MRNVTGATTAVGPAGERTAVQVMETTEGESEGLRTAGGLAPPGLLPSRPVTSRRSREQAQRHAGARPGLESSADPANT